ncbi:MAG: 50S ribosomal protein L32 [Candidatus Levybacteria bacterium]|nr:50S ribosomal protein L32 [Candidatus Levybacteria bacterium]
MPQEPKRRHSTQRKGKRRASIKLENPNVIFCQNCHSPSTPHTVCKNCGYYKGAQVLAKKEKAKVEVTTNPQA